MPRMKSEIYAAHMENLLRLAARDGGVSRPQAIQELNLSRPLIVKMIEEAKLVLIGKQGRTEFFGPPEKPAVKQSRPAMAAPEVEEPAVPEPATDVPALMPGTGDPELDALAELDREILLTRNTMRDVAKNVAKAAAAWSTEQAAFTGLHARLTELLSKRLKLSS